MPIEQAPRVFGVFVVLALALGASAQQAPPATSTPTAAPAARKYPLCGGQGTPVDPATISRTGDMPKQLAPALLDHMSACEAGDKAPPANLAVADAGKVNGDGDCEWPNGVKCHYHLGVEFVRSSDAVRPHLGELHCIFPSADDPASPDVFGGHFTCGGAPTALAQEPHGGHAVKAGASCGKGLLPALSNALSACPHVRCCDDGTLTTPVESRTAKGQLSVRPDFRICGAPMALDCGALANLHGHAANAPKYGKPVDTDFALPRALESAPDGH